MYEARKICNFLLARNNAERFELTNLRINKLLYFIHAESLAYKPDGLVRNHFEAWQYGPVIRPVFDAFKIYGDNFISAPAVYLDYASGQSLPIPYLDINESDQDLIQITFEQYCRFSTSQLISLSHEQNGPWDIVYKAHLADKTSSPRIPNDLIRRCFDPANIERAQRH
jgi:uncharacterized phage-associated protein